MNKLPPITRVYLRKPTASRPYYQLRFFTKGKKSPVAYRTLKCSKEIAEQVFNQAQNDIEQGKFSMADALPGLNDGKSYDEFARAYISYRMEKTKGAAASLSERTVKKDDEALAVFYKITQRESMSEVDEHAVEHFKHQMQTAYSRHGKPYTVSYINILIRHLSSAWTWAVSVGYAKRNPFKGAQIKRKGRNADELPRYLTNDEVAIVRERAAAKGKPRHWLWVIDFALATGMRRQEILTANVNNIYSDTIDGKPRYFLKVVGKGSKKRTVPLSAGVMEIVEEIKALNADPDELDKYIRQAVHSPDRSRNYERAREGYLFFMMSHVDSFSKMFRRIIKGTGIDANFHGLRHTFATRYIERGGDLKTLSTILGHSSVTTTEIYAKVTAKKMSDDFERLTAI